ncbi:MAG: methyltransferase [Microbacteriaceae bacterium]|nr:methyltransferase [Microbacteriaceae bacterium]
MDSNDWDARYEAADSVWSLAPNEFVVEYLERLPAGTMIDLAGGEGRNALWFASRGWLAENVDFSKVALDKFVTRAAEIGLADRCTATLVDATAAPALALAPADLGVIAYLQVEASGLAVAIASLVAGLKPGGTFFGVWHARENLADGMGGPQDATVLPTQAELRHALDAAGLPTATIALRERRVTAGTAIEMVAVATKQ